MISGINLGRSLDSSWSSLGAVNGTKGRLVGQLLSLWGLWGYAALRKIRATNPP